MSTKPFARKRVDDLEKLLALLPDPPARLDVSLSGQYDLSSISAQVKRLAPGLRGVELSSYPGLTTFEVRNPSNRLVRTVYRAMLQQPPSDSVINWHEKIETEIDTEEGPTHAVMYVDGHSPAIAAVKKIGLHSASWYVGEGRCSIVLTPYAVTVSYNAKQEPQFVGRLRKALESTWLNSQLTVNG